ncbi:MAG: magnesium transporter CorA [Clostridia bacterium]|nr:magnesium transporter CorA [Clostridia bacterium]
MIFEFTDRVKEIKFDNIKSLNNTVAFISVSEFEKFYSCFDFEKDILSKINREEHYFRSKTEICKDCIYGTLKIIEPDITNNYENKFAFFIKKHLFLIIEFSDSDHSIRKKFIESVNRLSPDEFKTEKFISVFVDNLISSDNKFLEDIDLNINTIEDKIIRENRYKNFDEELLKYKRKLHRLRNYYEQLIDIGQTFIENENNIFDNDNLAYFEIFIQKSERLCSDVNLLRDNVTQLRELYQSNLDTKLNNTMKLFTVITAVFSPLTLIAGWYGMNFRYMPELNWKYGYVYVIVLSVLTVSICIYIFKKKKLI